MGSLDGGRNLFVHRGAHIDRLGRDGALQVTPVLEQILLLGLRSLQHVLHHVVVALVPFSINPLQVSEITVGPPGNPSQLTGIDEGFLTWCTVPDAPNCTGHSFFQRYTVLSDATLDIQTLLVGGTTSVNAASIPLRPAPPARPNVRTFADPLSGNLSWITFDALPAP